MDGEPARYQLFPALPDDDYQALKRDIREHGVMVPIEFDDTGEILDGHHRMRAWTELVDEGVELEVYPRVLRYDLTEPEKRAHIRRLNILRRHLTQEQRRELIRDQVRETPERSNRQVAASLGVDHKTVAPIRSELEGLGEIPQVDTVTDTQGRQYPTHRSPPVRHASDPEIHDDYVEDVCQDIEEEASSGVPDDDAVTEPTPLPDEPPLRDLVEPAFVIPARGLDPHAKAWHAAVAPAMYRRLDPEAVIATREPQEIERGIAMMVDTIEYVGRLIEAARAAAGRARLEVVR